LGGLAFGQFLGAAPLRPTLGLADMLACALPGAVFLLDPPVLIAVVMFVVALAAMGIAEASEPALLAASGADGSIPMLLYGAVFNFGSSFGAGAGGALLAL
jgi:hypothetical protein